MLTIWKEVIPVTDEFEVKLPNGARVLSVQAQQGLPCIWFLCNPQRDKVSRRFRVHGTGHPIESMDGFTFLGTFQLHSGALVFHLFELASGKE